MSASSIDMSTTCELTNITNKMEPACTVNENNELCIVISDMPVLKTQEETACCVQFVLYKLQYILSVKERVDINLYMSTDIKMEMFKTIHLFFDIFKRELPNKLNKCRIYTKAKYKGMASLLLTFADRDTKSRMEIISIT